MELLLWRWSTTAQIASSLMIAVFFVVLAQSVKRVELRPWVKAWLANLGALSVTVIFWYAEPKSALVFAALRFGYFFSKTMFVVLLAAGVRRFLRGPARLDVNRGVVVSVAVLSAVAAIVVGDLDLVGVVGSLIIAGVLGASAIFLFLHRQRGTGWLTAGFTLRALLAGIEAVAHATRIVPNGWRTSKGVGVFLAAYSSFDTAAEWAIALGCVLILYRTIQVELTQSNTSLLAAQHVLQELVDRDPLTGLLNRRALPAILQSSLGTGATVVFFDLNDFKRINDSYGHHIGDAALQRFARALEACFGPDDQVIRYSGDEFVVVAQGSEPDLLADRLEQLRTRLRFEEGSGPAIHFAAGHASLGMSGDPDEALRAADAAMYKEKVSSGKRLRLV